MINWMKRNRFLAAVYGIALFTILGVSICAKWKIPMENLRIERPTYGEEEKKVQFYVQDEDGNEQQVVLDISPRKYTEEEAQKRIELCYQSLYKELLGNNQDWEHINEKLDLSIPEGFEDLNIMIYPAEYEYINADGEILFQELPEEHYDTILYLSIGYESISEQYELPLTILASEKYENQDTQIYLEQLEENSIWQETVELPDSFNGKKYAYYTKMDLSGVVGVSMILLSTVFFLWYRRKALANKEEKERSEQLEADYPELISKILIYMKAGMSVRKSWQKLVADYNARKKRCGERYLYEEMAVTLQEIELGFGERKAYLKFGKRCGVQCMIRFGSLLEQNLRKGNSGIMNLLEAERIQALEHKKQEIKSAGEIAAIKLMMPMMVIFGLIMCMIMIPSFMAFGI